MGLGKRAYETMCTQWRRMEIWRSYREGGGVGRSAGWEGVGSRRGGRNKEGGRVGRSVEWEVVGGSGRTEGV
jgi:hypothetical protein